MVKMLIDINMFNINQTVFLMKNNQKVENFKVSLTDLIPHIAATLDAEKDISEIEFQGHMTFLTQLTTDLITLLKTKYADRNVRIITNGKVFAE